MSWFFIALGAHILWASVNLADQYLVAKFKESNAPQITLIMFAAPIALIVSGIIGYIYADQIAYFSYESFFWLIIAGIIQVLGIYAYIQALLRADASAVSAWFLAMPIFGYLFGYLLLGEVLTFTQVVGMAVIIIGALVFSTHYHYETKKHSVPWNMIAFMIVASLLLVFSDVLFKKGAPNEALFWPALAVVQFGTAFMGIILLGVSRLRREFFRMCVDQGRKVFTINVISELITMTGNALKYVALLLAPVALVASLEGYQPLIVYLMAIPLAFLAPQYFHFHKTRWHFFLKVVGAGMLIAGTYLLI